MNRRQFCKGLFGAAVALAIPTVPVVSEPVKQTGNVWLKPEDVAKEALDHVLDAMRYIEIGQVTEFTMKTEEGEEICLGKGKIYMGKVPLMDSVTGKLV